MSRKRPIRTRTLLLLEALEDRLVPSSIVVTTASDAATHTGTSLRDAIMTANTDAAAGTSDTITFASTLAGQTISLTQGTLNLNTSGGTITINGVGSTGYAAGDVLTVLGGTTANGLPTDGSVTNPDMATLQVVSVSGGAVTSATVLNAGAYLTNPPWPAAVTGGGGSGAMFYLSSGGVGIVDQILTADTIGTAGTGYKVGDALLLSGGVTPNGLATNGSVNNPQMAVLTVTSVSSGSVTGVTILNTGVYNTAPSVGGTVIDLATPSATGVAFSGLTFTSANWQYHTIATATVASGGGVGPIGITVSGAGSVEDFSIGAGVTAVLDNLTITGGSAASVSGGVSSAGTLTVDNCTINGNLCGSGINGTGGGGIGIIGGSGTVENSTITGNSASGGFVAGGLWVTTGSLVVTDCTITGNTTSASGGAVMNYQGTLTVVNCIVSGNKGVAGAVCNDQGHMTVLNTTIANNTSGFAGGIENSASAVASVVNSTIAGNTSTNNGGGVDTFGTSLAVTNCTITGNSTSGTTGGGGIDVVSGTLTLLNSIVAGNTASAGPGPDINGTGTVSSSNSLIGNTSGSGIAAGNGNVLNPASAGLGSLANNGGPNEPTSQPQTVLLQSGSPAVAAGAAVTTTNAAITTTTATSITIANSDGFLATSLPTLATGSYCTIQIDGEQMAVTGVAISGSTATLTVSRGANGTTAATHLTGASVFLVSDELGDLVNYASAAAVDMGAIQNTPASGPAITGVSSTTPAGTYGAGTVIPITVTFSAPVVVTGTPTLALNTTPGAVANYAGAPGGTVTTLATFSGTNGQQPVGGMVEDGAGNLFGTTQHGGTSGDGTVFEVAAGTHTLTTLVTFSGTNGIQPNADLVMDSSGNLFGATLKGGTGSVGTVFEVAAGTHVLTTLANFTGINGQFPDTLIEDSGGNLFGTTEQGGTSNVGTVFEIAAGTLTFTTLVNFTAANGGDAYGLIEDSAGNLFGTTGTGGTSNDGTVFEITAGSHALATLASFDGANGQSPTGLVEDSSGDLFGITNTGGASNEGTVYEVASGSGAITSLATFTGSNGSFPQGGAVLTLDSSGNLFGTTGLGGASNDGTIFEVAAGTHALTTLVTFTGANGDGPFAGLIEDSSGDFFGTTFSGGASNDGTVFELAAASSTTLTFNYTVAAGQSDPRLDYTNTSALSLNGGTIQNTSGTNASLTLPATGSDGLFNQNIVIGTSTAPTVTGVSPNTGHTPGGTTVTITGTNFTGATAVDFGTTPATSFTVNSATQITAVTPKETAGTVDTTVTTAGGTSSTSSSDHFTYTGPTVLSSSPTTGPTSGGTVVTITGINFTGATAVMFGIMNAASFTVNSDTSITAVTAAEPPSSNSVTVITPGGQENSPEGFQFVASPTPSVTAVTPSNGSTAGGTSVTITGTNFTGATAVSFGGAAATSFTVNSATQITAVAPAAAAGMVNIIVTTPTGTSAVVASDQFTYVIPLAITTSSLPNWTANLAGYDPTIATSGGTAPITFAVTSGVLPSGLSLNAATGAITGTPTTAGTFNFTITATDANSTTASAPYSVTISPAVAISTTSLPAWTANLTGYSQTIVASGGTGALTFAVASGSLPAGLSLNTSTGAITGTPTTAGNASFTISATDTLGASAQKSYSVTINPAVSISTTSLPGWITNEPGYSQTIAAGGGTGALGFAVSLGVLPTGLNLNNATGGISGTPTSGGTFSFTITATDTIGASAAQAYSVTIGAGAVSKLSFLSQPTNTSAGSTIDAITILAEDAEGNAVSGTTISIGLTAGTLTSGAAPLTTNASGKVVFSSLIEDKAGTYALSASATGVSSVLSNAFTITALSASTLIYLSQPSSTTAGSVLNAITVQVADQFANPVAGAAVTIGISPGSLTTGGGALTTNTLGQVVFSTLSEDTAGTYTLSATTSGVAAVPSTSFIITAQASTARLAFVSQPSGTTAGSTINPVTVLLADQFGNAVSGVAVGITSTPKALSTGTTPLTTNGSGEVVFADLSQNSAGTYDLTATSTGLASVSSNPFTITPGAAAALLFVNQPTGASAGSTINAVTVKAVDQYGNGVSNVVVGMGLTVEVALGGNAPLTTNSLGVAVFSDLQEDTAGTYTLLASSSNLSNVTSSSFTIVAGKATSLAFVTEPSSTSAGSTLNAVEVEAEDTYGNLVSGLSVGISISPGTLSAGTTPITSNAAGMATFSDLVEDVAGTYNLTATAAGTGSVTSSAFTISAGAASKLSFVSQPSSTHAGSTLNPITVQVADRYGNAVAGGSIGIALVVGTLTTGTTPLTSNAAGQVVFNDLSEDTTGSYTLTASSSGLTSVNSQGFVITAAPAARLTFVTEPKSVVAGASLNAITVLAIDGYNNLVVGGSVSLGLTPAGTLNGIATAITNSAGEAVFSNMTVTTGGLFSFAAASGEATATSNPFAVTNSTDRFTFVTQPTGTTAGSSIGTVTVQLADSAGALLPGVTVSIGMTTGTLAGTGAGTTNSSGQVTFSGLSVTKVGTYALSASSTDIDSALSNAFKITAGTPSKFTMTQPGSTSAGKTLSPITVTVADQFGNLVAGATVSLSPSAGKFAGTTTETTSAAGQAVFSNVSETQAGTFTCTAAVANAGSMTSAPFTITAAAASNLAFTTQPLSTTAGSSLGPVSVKATDAYGNLAAGTTVSLLVSLGTVDGTTTATTNSSGLAVFSNLYITKTGTYTLSAAATGISKVASNSFVIKPAAGKLSIVAQPASTTTGTTLHAVTILVMDQYGNVVVGDAVSVALSAGTLSGATTVTTNASGEAVFSNLSVATIESGDKLIVSAAGSTSITSSAFNIT